MTDIILTYNIRGSIVFFKKVDYFTKYKWIVLLKNKTTKNLLDSFNMYYNPVNYSGTELENRNNKPKNNIELNFETTCNLQHQSSVNVFNWTVEDCLTK